MKFTTPLNLWSCTSIIRAPSIQLGIWPAGLASAKLAHDPLAINLTTLAGLLGDNGKPWSCWEADTASLVKLEAETRAAT